MGLNANWADTIYGVPTGNAEIVAAIGATISVEIDAAIGVEISAAIGVVIGVVISAAISVKKQQV